MADKRDRKRGKGDSKGSDRRRKRKAERAPKGIRSHLRRLEAMLTTAQKKESARVRKLQKAHLRRQRIEAEIDEIRLATAPVAKAAPAAAAEPADAPGAPGAAGAPPPAAPKQRRLRTTKPSGA